MRITVDAARDYFSDPSQVRGCGIEPDALPDEPFEYWASLDVCAAFHPAHWPGVWMGHYGVKPSAWGRTVAPGRAILAEFCEARNPGLIIGWTPESNRAALSFVRRLGFTETGKMNVPGGAVVMTEYRP